MNTKSSSAVSNPYTRRSNSNAPAGKSKTSSAAPTPANNRGTKATITATSKRKDTILPSAGTGQLTSSLSSSLQTVRTRTPTPTTFSQAFGDEGDYVLPHQNELQTSSSLTSKSKKSGGVKELNDGASCSSASATDQQQQQQQQHTVAATASTTAAGAAAATALIQPHVLLVSTKQRGNGLLRYIRNVPYTYSKIVPDYIMGPNRCALFLSLKYHNLHPQYILRRIAELEKNFDLRLLLCLVDVDDNASILKYLNTVCVRSSMTLLLSWSEEEAARYLESFKAFEGKDASSIQKKKETTYIEQAVDVLGCVRSVNKTDVAQLLSQFGTVQSLVTANSVEDIRQCPGIGEKKVRRLFDAFHKPFSSSMAKKRREAREERERLASIERDIADAEEGYLSLQDDFYEEDGRVAKTKNQI